MCRTTEGLARFVTQTRFDDLPRDVVYEMKRVILDSIGCALNGASTHRGKIAMEMARTLGGPAEATIIGSGDKVSCANAAFANGELTNALDFDAFGEGHDAPIVIPAALGVAERAASSGKKLILAVALGMEVSARLKEEFMAPVSEGTDRGKMRWPAVQGYSVISLGAAGGAGKILGLNQEKMENAIGIAGCICPPPIVRKFRETAPVRMTKYGSSGWGAHVGVASALLAGMGYTGDTDLFEGEFGLWRYLGREKWKTPEEVLADIGTGWRCHHVTYKHYPGGI